MLIGGSIGVGLVVVLDSIAMGLGMGVVGGISSGVAFGELRRFEKESRDDMEY